MIDAVELYGLQARDDPFWKEFERARAMLAGPEWQHGLAELEALAHAGSMLSTICVASCMLEGWGYDQDLLGAETWYRVAAESGYTHGLYGLGITYIRMGRFSEAAQELPKAVSQNYRPAHHGLASLYWSGQGVSLDRRKALALWRVGASQGHHEAKAGLAMALIHGHGGFAGRFEGLRRVLRLVCEIARRPTPPQPMDHPFRPTSTVH